jgi:hypothetical protein
MQGVINALGTSGTYGIYIWTGPENGDETRNVAFFFC